MKKNLFLLTSIFLFGSGASANSVDQNGILRDADGSVLQLNQQAAIRACADLKMHLPTVRELAKISQSMGAKGILETSEVKEGEHPAGYYLVIAQNSIRSLDKFYFSYEGYRRPEGDLGNYWFWSSSVFSKFPDYGFGLSGIVGGVSGAVRIADYAAVRCVSTP